MPAKEAKDIKNQEGLFPRSLETVWSCQHLNFGLPASKTVKQHIPVVLSQPVCGTCYSSSETLRHTHKHLVSFSEGATIHPWHKVKGYEMTSRRVLCTPQK